MRFIHQQLWNLGGHRWLAAAIAVLGVVILVMAAAALLRSPAKEGKPSSGKGRGVWYFILGSILLLIAGGSAALRFDVLRGDVGTFVDLPADEFRTTARKAEAKGAWPQWRGPWRDGVSTETNLNKDWKAKPPPTIWKAPIGGGWSSCAVADGRLYTMDKLGDQERVVCLDANTGKEIWKHSYAVDYRGIDGSYQGGPRATPAVADGRIYAFGASGVLTCLQASTPDGKAIVLWQCDVRNELSAELPQYGFASSPLVDGGRVIVLAGGDSGSVLAFDCGTGNLVWKALSDKAGYSSAVAADIDGVRHIIAFTGEYLAGVRAQDGKELWAYRWTTDFYANIATPIVVGRRVFISSDYGAGCALVEITSTSADDFQVKEIWVRRNKLMRNHHSSSVLYEGHLYGFDKDHLKCVDPSKAEEKWATRESAKGSVIAAAGHLIVLGDDGVLTLVEATPQGFRGKGKLELADGPQIWALPALADGRLYVRTGGQIICLDVKP